MKIPRGILFWGGKGRINADILDGLIRRCSILTQVTREDIYIYQDGVIHQEYEKNRDEMRDLVLETFKDCKEVMAVCSARTRHGSPFSYLVEFDETIQKVAGNCSLTSVVIIGSAAYRQPSMSQGAIYHMEKGAEASLAGYYGARFCNVFETWHLVPGQIASKSYEAEGYTSTTTELLALLISIAEGNKILPSGDRVIRL